jgi:RNA-directed DNA polymerase
MANQPQGQGKANVELGKTGESRSRHWCAPAYEIAWNQINWNNVTAEVTRLEARIAKAKRGRKWDEVPPLSQLLSRSRSGKALTVKRVRENAGKRTARVDGRI